MEKYKLISIAVIVFGLTTISLFGQEDARVKEFYSPLFLSGTWNETAQAAPQSDAVNPASSALYQRTTLDLSYMGIVGDEGNLTGQHGFAFNLGNTIPTRAGVFSWSAHMLKSDYINFNVPFYFGVSGSFAKDLYPNLLAGLGVKAAYSSLPGYSAAVDLGVIYLSGTLGKFTDTAVGLTLADLGYSTISKGYQQSFTPSAGVSGTLFKTDNFVLKMNSNISSPGLSSVFMSLGGSFDFKNILSLTFGSRMDLKSLLRGNSAGLIPSVGLNFRFNPSLKNNSTFLGLSEKGWNKGQVELQSSFAPIADGIWSYGAGANVQLGVLDKEPPEIEIDISGFESQSMNVPEKGHNGKYSSGKKRSKRIVYVDSDKNTTKKNTRKSDGAVLTYLSPNNDGIKDDLKLPIKIKDSRYIKGYSLVVTDSEGNIVREIKNKEKRSENQGFMGFFDRLTAVKSGIDVPEELRWDGYNESGKVVPDGRYYFYVEAWDDNGNLSKTKEYTVVIDNTPPEVTITEPPEEEKIFSPNNDGSKDTLLFSQNGSVEDKWTGTILDTDGTVVKTFEWLNSGPEKVVWNGLDNNGNMVLDGVYSYVVKSTDRAGNSVEKSFQNIIKNTEETPIALKIDKQFFSPNNDKIMDTIILAPDVSVKTGLVSWTLSVFNSKRDVEKVFSGTDTIPENLIYQGRDDSGIILKEGTYYALLDVKYINGNNPAAKSPEFIVDVTPPSATVRVNTRVFSPNGDGQKDTVKFFQETSLEEVWTASIYSADGDVKYDYNWIGTAEPEVEWNGIGKDGRLGSDGVYTYQLSAIDRAGNLGKSNIVSFKLDTEQTAVILTTEYDVFSPNNDGSKDEIKIIPELSVKEGISAYKLSIYDNRNSSVRVFEGKKKIPEYFLWDGRDTKGITVPDGEYYAKLELEYNKGDKPSAVSGKVEVDTKFPEIKLATDYLLFSPDGDGKKDSVVISQRSEGSEQWRGEILDSEGNTVKTVFWKNKVTNFLWDGSDTAGNIVKDGAYTYTVSAEDQAGNLTKKEVKGITVDTSITKVFITASDSYLSPTGNGKYDTLTLKTIVTNKKGIVSWSLKLIREDTGKIEKLFTGENRIPSKIIWDGVNDEGRYSEGEYTAVFKVVYLKGNEPEAHSSKFVLDVSPPRAILKLSPVPFSPDNDGLNDELTLSLDVSDLSGVEAWELNIYDPEKKPFISFSGKGTPANAIIWNGKSSTGELVYAAMDYPVIFKVKDILGNVTVKQDRIPIDVLVVKEGNVLKIKIANIVFKRNSADFVDDDPEKARTNEYVLNRISEILKKYKSYQIVIEGHAVVTKWYDEKAAEKENIEELIPLSRERAMTVLHDLVERGIAASRMEAVGAGGADPLVPNSDLENRWKNRRVEFILRKK